MAISKDPVVDVLIIGGSHAGLSAALTLYRALHTSIIFDSKKPRNDYPTLVRLTPTWENKTPEEMREASRKELQSTGFTTFVDSEVTSLERIQDELFQATDTNGAIWLGRKVLFATGAQDVFPDITGYADLYAKSMYVNPPPPYLNFPSTTAKSPPNYPRYPCMFQFGYEHRGSPSAGLLAVDGLAHPMHALALAQDGHKFAQKMTIYTNANPTLAAQISAALPPNQDMAVDDRKIKRLVQGSSAPAERVVLEFEEGGVRAETFLVHRAMTKVDTTLAEQLGVEVSAMGDLKVAPPFCKTNVAGVYAAGDNSTMMKTIANAMTMGAYAGCGLARELPKRT
ncbi:thioredoxin reductase [Pyrenophora seminiperda CCB06]|uniref:Thioredoxin reductase n=1 Tax=Pyrenophora seminiperda CCB06 TaxID=1302712 RepID=A0A3M7LVF8_9PLEO|nr:thioredoxin reductase [Pyrenophora seminiperda CCB06]